MRNVLDRLIGRRGDDPGNETRPGISTWFRRRDTLDTRIAALFPGDPERRAARALLAPVLSGAEAQRVAMACLKLCDGEMARLEKWVEQAAADYRDAIAWAEYPREMRLGPGAPAADRARARREDADEYRRWRESSKH